MENKRKALIIGATGLVGNELLHRLLDCDVYDKVTALVRRPTGISDSKLHEKVIDFDEMGLVVDEFAVDDVFCTKGVATANATACRGAPKTIASCTSMCPRAPCLAPVTS